MLSTSSVDWIDGTFFSGAVSEAISVRQKLTDRRRRVIETGLTRNTVLRDPQRHGVKGRE